MAFGGGWLVQCRGRAGGARAWRGVQARAPGASLRVLHQHTLHFLVPATVTVDNKEIRTRLSDVFRLMAELQSTCDIEDYTINQSSLEQMFLSFTDKAEVPTDTVDVEPLPALRPPDSLRSYEDLDTVTSL
ncbi:ATP-binding cassette sub-family A member 7-like [Trichoplusia ni]|uniref:ATP-binding cassette sub-family A member 7-like n=1 Tax=Trichoplusia ni TaxID=7111 RepID=A0A7E5W986_TRINI|nr:ATP-binding cassette sub-family A member 7-like [Trichoplusia ni]